MERVSGEGFFSYRREVRGDKKSRKTGSRSFSTELGRVSPSGDTDEREPETSDAEVADLMDAVFAAGDALKRDISREAMEEYKHAVRSFVSVVVKRGYAVEERTSGASVAKRKRFALVQVIDEKLDRLVQSVYHRRRIR